MNRFIPTVLFLLVAFVWGGQAAEPRTPQAPEPNPPRITNTNAFSPAKVGLSAGPTLYSIGQPTDDEQLYLELINRARANPPAEGIWLSQLTDLGVLNAVDFFDVNLPVMVAEFSIIPPAQPLAFNSAIIAAARLHSAVMFTNQVQEHQVTSVGEPDLGQRLLNQGYTLGAAGENIFSYSENTLYGHAGFQIDWGNDADGMQTGRGHRVNIHRADFREIGVGIYEGVNGPVGPQLVTQDFARSQADLPLLSGVVYHDLNSNVFYDLGEGLGGVSVQVTGAQFYAITATSGGYTIPLPGNGNYTVTFTAANGGTFTTNVTVAANLNVKVDWRPAYQAPVLTGPLHPVSGFNMGYNFTTPIGITNYSWQVLALTPFTFTDNADTGLANFSTTLTGSYSVTGADTQVARPSVFHLVHPAPPTLQALELNTRFIPKTGATLTFQSRLAFATTNQIPVVQISQNGGVTWQDVWTQTGGSQNPNAPYQLVTINLGSLPRLETRLRFAYTYVFRDSGSYYSEPSYIAGWMFDNISLTGADTGSIAGSSLVNNASLFQFTSASTSSYLVVLKPSVQNRNYPGSNVLEIQSVAAPTVTISGLQNTVTKKFDVGLSHVASGSVKVFSATSVTGPWTEETGTGLETLTPERNFRVTLPIFSGNRFYRAQLAP
ncbi:MAG: SCP-like extracellular [Verrucomicrobia bacterium]|jgi:hypothetical protein|nr:SCP-like extracellular [Verrucomicrobiota bacterium]